MTGFHEVRFPDNIAYGATGGPEFATTVVVTGAGHEQRNVDWAEARGRWDVASGLKNQQPLDELIAFFRARKGKAYGFRLAAVLNHTRLRQLLSREHFSVDGTLIEAWASMKSFRPKDDADQPPTGGRNGSRDFHGERRRNDSHASTTDGEARVFRKGAGKAAKLCIF